MSQRPSVLIVGAGPTGLVMAHELARGGVNCRVIDKRAQRSTHSKAIAIHSRTLETFELMQIVDDFLAAGQRIAGVGIHGEHGPIAHIGFGALDTRYPYVLGVPQDETERILEEHMARHGIRVERNTELVWLTPHDSGVRAQLRIEDRVGEVEADWLIGCDGPHSTVREELAIPFAGSTYPELFVLADVKIEADFDHAEARVYLHPDGALAFFPLPEDRWRLIVTNSPADWQQEPSLGQCQALVDERAPGGIRLSDPRWTSVFRIHRREAAQFRRGRIFLAGDAAHIHSPVGGQGMNAGICDAVNLAWKLSLALSGAHSPKLLDSYEAERKPVDEAVIRQTDRATRLVSLHGSVTRFMRDHLMSLLTRLPSVEERIGEAVSGTAVNYRQSPIVEDHPIGGTGPHAGDRAPDAVVSTVRGGASLRLGQLVAEHRHVLLLITDDSVELPPAPPEFPGYPLAVYRVSPSGIQGGELIDCNSEIAAHYGSAPAAYLIRPDGYIGFRCLAGDMPARLQHYLADLFGSVVGAHQA
ncbi:MAG TPA: FAD-dependent monooxygenase [Stellaceae bacterium]|jgi:2-polyprenyl-6-methoxyphenol hydroxylase-like FAD-dependent oxidoreductase